MHTFYVPKENTEDTVALAWIEGAQVGFHEDGRFHSMNDATSIRYAIEMLASARASGRWATRGGGAEVVGS